MRSQELVYEALRLELYVHNRPHYFAQALATSRRCCRGSFKRAYIYNNIYIERERERERRERASIIEAARFRAGAAGGALTEP